MSYLGRFLVEQGAITESQLEDGLRFQRESNRRIGQLAVDKGLLTPEEVTDICRRQQDDACLFGDIAVRERHLSRRGLDELLFLQKVHYTYLGEALLQRGHITPEQYRQLLGRYYDLLDNERVSLRYLNEFFAENKILDILVQAVDRALRRCAGETLTICGVGRPFAPEEFPCRLLVEGTVLEDRRLAAWLGLSAGLAAGLEAGERQFFGRVGRFFRDMLRESGLALSEERLTAGGRLAAAPSECAFVRCQGPSGQAGLALWLTDTGKPPRT